MERGVLVISGWPTLSPSSRTDRGTADVDFGNAAIVPGFVNAHTHLGFDRRSWLDAADAGFHRLAAKRDRLSKDADAGASGRRHSGWDRGVPAARNDVRRQTLQLMVRSLAISRSVHDSSRSSSTRCLGLRTRVRASGPGNDSSGGDPDDRKQLSIDSARMSARMHHTASSTNFATVQAATSRRLPAGNSPRRNARRIELVGSRSWVRLCRS